MRTLLIAIVVQALFSLSHLFLAPTTVVDASGTGSTDFRSMLRDPQLVETRVNPAPRQGGDPGFRPAKAATVVVLANSDVDGDGCGLASQLFYELGTIATPKYPTAVTLHKPHDDLPNK